MTRRINFNSNKHLCFYITDLLSCYQHPNIATIHDYTNDFVESEELKPVQSLREYCEVIKSVKAHLQKLNIYHVMWTEEMFGLSRDGRIKMTNALWLSDTEKEVFNRGMAYHDAKQANCVNVHEIDDFCFNRFLRKIQDPAE